LAVVAVALPALVQSRHPERAVRLSGLHLSEAVALILLATYGLSLLFALKPRRRRFAAESHSTEGPVWSAGKAVAVLGLATVAVAIESEILVHAAAEATRT